MTISSDLHEAVIAGDLQKVKLVVCVNPSLANTLITIDGYEGVTPLHLSVKYNQLEMVAFLVDNGADLELEDRDFEATVLGWAAFFGQKDIVEPLIDMGAEVTARCNPLMIANDGRNGEWKEFTFASIEDYQAVMDLLRRHGAPIIT